MCRSATITLQGTQLVYCQREPVALATSMFGISLWAIGLSVNIASDCALQDLRRGQMQKGVPSSVSALASHVYPITDLYYQANTHKVSGLLFCQHCDW